MHYWRRRLARTAVATVLRCGWLLSATSSVLLIGGPIGVFAEDSSNSPTATAQALVGTRVNIKLQSGKTLKDVTVEEVRPGKIPGTVAKLRVTDAATGASRSWERRPLHG